MITYDSLLPGQIIGRRDFLFDLTSLDAWLSLFPADLDGGVMPPGMMAVVAMHAFGEILAPRAPGNVHASQRYEVLRLPLLGERLVTAVSCAGKEILRGRRRVTIETDTRDMDDMRCFLGIMAPCCIGRPPGWLWVG